jgi:hypothetical protein
MRDAVTATYPQAPFTSPPLGTKCTVEVITSTRDERTPHCRRSSSDPR